MTHDGLSVGGVSSQSVLLSTRLSTTVRPVRGFLAPSEASRQEDLDVCVALSVHRLVRRCVREDELAREVRESQTVVDGLVSGAPPSW